jgi:acetyl esterase/lipase
MSPAGIVLRGLALAVAAAALGCASTRSRTPSPPPVSRAQAPAPPDRAPRLLPTSRVPDLATEVQTRTDVVYGTAGGEPLKLDVYIPTNLPGPLPAIVVLHGGGWYAGAKEDCRAFAQAFADYGYVAVSPGYRLAPRHRFPAPLEDVKCAVRWLRANAQEFHVDPDRIGAMGISAGGHLALMLGVTGPDDGFEGQGGHAAQSSLVRAVISLMGPTDLARTGWMAGTERMIIDLMGGTREQIPAAYRAASPLAYVRSYCPPVLLVHGTQDPVVPYEQADALQAALRGAGVESWLEPLPGKGHGFDWSPLDWQRCRGLMIQFADQHLRRR